MTNGSVPRRHFLCQRALLRGARELLYYVESHWNDENGYQRGGHVLHLVLFAD